MLSMISKEADESISSSRPDGSVKVSRSSRRASSPTNRNLLKRLVDSQDSLSPCALAFVANGFGFRQLNHSSKGAECARKMRHRVIELVASRQHVSDAADLGSDGAELFFDLFVASIDVVDAVDDGFAVGDQGCQNQRSAGAQVTG
jgi:hypothetical protein